MKHAFSKGENDTFHAFTIYLPRVKQTTEVESYAVTYYFCREYRTVINKNATFVGIKHDLM